MAEQPEAGTGEQEGALSAGEIAALTEQGYFREYIPQGVKNAINDLIFEKKLKPELPQKDREEVEDKLQETEKDPGKVFDEVEPPKRKGGVILQAGKWATTGGFPQGPVSSRPAQEVEVPDDPKVPLSEEQKVAYKRQLADEVAKALRRLEGEKGQKIADAILDKKNKNPEETSLFLEIQRELNKLRDNPDERLEEGLIAVRKILIDAAKKAGVFDEANDQLKQAQTVDDYTRQIELIDKINPGNLDEQAAEALMRASPDFNGMNVAYVYGARLWMQWGMYVALGDEKEAEKKKREIDLMAWGKDRSYFQDTAQGYLDGLAGVRVALGPKRGEASLQRGLVERGLDEDEEAEKKLDEIEERLVRYLIRDVLRGATDAVGDNINIYPYSPVSHELDNAGSEFDRLINGIRDKLEAANGQRAGRKRAEVILGRLERIRGWYEGATHLLQGAGPVLENYYDGLRMMLAVKQNPRIDINMVDFYQLYTFHQVHEGNFNKQGDFVGLGPPADVENMLLASEIVRKQDACFEILRGISAAHRHRGRNAGHEIVPTTTVEDLEISKVNVEGIVRKWEKALAKKAEALDNQQLIVNGKSYPLNAHTFGLMRATIEQGQEISATLVETGSNFDYPVNRRQIEFIERVFRSKEWKPDSGARVLMTDSPAGIDQVLAGKDAFGTVALEARAKESKGSVLDILMGEEIEITQEFIKEWLEDTKGNLGDKSLWVDGSQWIPPEGDIEDRPEGQTEKERVKLVIDELKNRIGSGDKVFLGVRKDVSAVGAAGMRREIEASPRVAILREIPGALDNLFVMAQDAETVSATKRKIEVMMQGEKGEQSIWEKLKDANADVDALEAEFNEELRKYKGDIINRHIVDMSRIALLYFCEGANLGWGFEYSEDKNLGVYKRQVSAGSTKACTDINTPFDFLRTEGVNNWKDWTHGATPMDKRMAWQLAHHEPGWAPRLNGETWELTYMGKTIKLDVPRRFVMSLFEAVKVTKGKNKDKRFMDLIFSRTNGNPDYSMSNLPYMKTDRDAPYRTYVTRGQTVIVATILTKPPDRDSISTYAGFDAGTKAGYAIFEWIKRSDLGYRDMQKASDVRRATSWAEAVNVAWITNVLPLSPHPGSYLPYQVRDLAGESRAQLRQLAPRGEKKMAERMVGSFDKDIDWLLDTGKDYKVMRARMR